MTGAAASSRAIVLRVLPLACHPDSPCQWVRNIEVEARTVPDCTLALGFRLTGELERLRIPPPRAPRRANDLWRHTCFEAFVAAGEETAYHELNFSPSGEWAAYRFRGYRNGMSGAPDLDPQICVRRAPDRLELDAVIRLQHVPALRSRMPLRLALSAVVEDSAGELAYWALRHPPGKPDFHHADAFALVLAPQE